MAPIGTFPVRMPGRASNPASQTLSQACPRQATGSNKPTVFAGETVGFLHHSGRCERPRMRLDVPGKGTNCNLAYRNRRTTWLPLWGSWLPRKGQTERATRFDALMLLSHCGTLSVSLTAASSPKGRAKGAAAPAR